MPALHAEAEARAVAEAAADAQRGPPPEAQRAFRVPMESVPDLLMVWEFTQVGAAACLAGQLSLLWDAGGVDAPDGDVEWQALRLPPFLSKRSGLHTAAASSLSTHHRHSATSCSCRPSPSLHWRLPWTLARTCPARQAPALRAAR